MRALLGAATFAALVAAAGPAAAGESVETVVRRLAAERDAVVTIDEALRGMEVAAETQNLPLETVRALLREQQIEVIDDEAGGRPLLKAILIKNLPMTIPNPKVLGEDEPIPEGNRYVSKTYRIRGNPIDIQTAIRAAMTRDPRKLGSISYMPATKTLTIADLAPSMHRWEQMIADLDRPAARTEKLRLDLEVWSLANDAAAALREKTGPPHDFVRSQPGARLVANVSGENGLTAELSDTGDAANALQIAVDVQPDDRDAGGLTVQFGLDLTTGAKKLKIPRRSLALRAGEWHLVHAGDPGVAVFVRARGE